MHIPGGIGEDQPTDLTVGIELIPGDHGGGELHAGQAAGEYPRGRLVIDI